MRLKVLNVDRQIIGGVPCWRVKYEATELVGDEQPIFYHIFPESQFHFVMAAYGAEDAEEILDMILADPFQEQDPAASLLTAETVEEAKSSHVSRCARAKLSVRISSRGIQNPLQMIRESFVPDSESRAYGEQALRNARQEYRRNNRG